MNDLIVLGLDVAAVKDCWMRTPDLLKLQPGALLDKVAVIQTLFPGTGILEVLQSDPSVFLLPSKSLRERAQLLLQLGSVMVTLADVRYDDSDAAFAMKTVGKYLEASGKSLTQMCRELQAQPGVSDYMEAHEVDPDTMDEHKYFVVVTQINRPQRVSSGGNVGPAFRSE